MNQTETEQKDKDIEKYLNIGKQCKSELDALYSSINSFQLSLTDQQALNIQDQKFSICTSVSYSNQTKHKSDPLIWYTETLCPGNYRVIYESWVEPQHRLKWDSFISKSNKIMIDASNPNLFVLNTATKPAAGGIISARDFVNLLRIYELKGEEEKDGEYQAMQIASRGIEMKGMPEKKGFVRGVVNLSGVIFEKVGQRDIKDKYKLPTLRMIHNKQCEWTRIRYIVQSDIKGWLPTSIVDKAMASTNNGMMRDLRKYVIEHRLRFK